MIRKLLIGAATALVLAPAAMAENKGYIEDHAFSFEGPFGTYDQFQLQRGLQVFTEVCAACHGLKYVPIRTLSDEGGPGLPEDQVRAYAAAFPVMDEASNPQLIDPLTDEIRALVSSDNFPVNYTFEPHAPDLSMMAKARKGFSGPYGTGISQLINGIGGPEYLYSLLTGYVDPPECGADFDTGYYNRAFAKGAIPETCKDEHGHATIVGSWIAMPPPLSADQVTYADGHPATLENMSADIAAFLMWSAEPKMMARKDAGLTAVLFLTILSVLLYLTNKRIWANVKGRKTHG